MSGVGVCENRLLDYADSERSAEKLRENMTDIMSFIKSFGGRPILHCHNPNLGKNPALSLAVFNLAVEGYPVINHCHDFAEDRPENISLLERIIPEISSFGLNQVLYPDFAGYHFIVLNSCDYERIKKKGVSTSRIHLLANPVAINESLAHNAGLKKKMSGILSFDPNRKLCTYPVRAIRRKNLAEFVLLAALYADEAHFAVTMAPRNPEEIPQYQHWKLFCQHLNIPVSFEAGEKVAYEELICASDFCVTTSIREGFGMAYLEPWMSGTPVIGRELPCIIDDLRRAGLQFPGLYKGIFVNKGGRVIDFKDLTQQDQESLIMRIRAGSETKQELIQHNPFMSNWLDIVQESIITSNQQIIRQRFSIEEYGKEISGVYRKVSE